jgi:cytoskeletal protein RodZ
MATRSQRIQSLKSIGHYLKTARRGRGFSIDDVARGLHIAFKYIEAIEIDNFKAIPSEIIESSIRKYARYVHLDEQQMWQLYLIQKRGEQKRYFGLNFQYLQMWPRLVRRGILAGIAVLVVIFLFIKVEQIFIAPPLTITEPRDGDIIYTPQTVVKGISEPESEIVINNKAVLVDTAGQFETVIDLQKGLNLIKITAKKRYSRIQESQLHILYESQN